MELLIVLVILIMGNFIWKLLTEGLKNVKINNLSQKYIRHLEYGQKAGALKAGEGITKIEIEIKALGYDPDLILTEYGNAKFENRTPDHNKCKICHA